MAGLDHIKVKFWGSLTARGAQMNELVRDVARGDGAAREQLGSLVHTIKGEAQLLSLESCAKVLEKTDSLVKALSSHGYAPSALTALATVASLLMELGNTSGTSQSVESTLRLVEVAIANAANARAS